MNCADALEWMEAGELGGAADAEAELAEAHRHLVVCPECQAAWPVRQVWARTLSATMSQVEIPSGLRGRLLADVPVVASAPVSVPRPRRRRLAFGLASVSVLLLLAAILLNSVRPLPPSPVLLPDLYAGAAVEYAELPAFSGTFLPRLPAEWTSVFSLDQALVRGFPKAGPATGAAAFIPFQFTVRGRQEPLRGRLLMVPRAQFALFGGTRPQPALSSRFSSAAVRYVPESAAAFVVWEEDDLVFVCLMPSGPADLERFVHAMSGTRSMT